MLQNTQTEEQKLENEEKKLYRIGYRCQFHQHFMRAFFVRKLSLVTFQLSNFWRQNFIQKRSRETLMELTEGVSKVPFPHNQYDLS
jgi:hypothetical protein